MTLAHAIAGAFTALQGAAGVSVTLKRGNLTTEDVRAVLGTSRGLQETDGNGAMIVDSRDYLIKVADYAFGGLKAEPRPGDLIEETSGGRTLRYELRTFGGDKAARHADPERLLWRCHVIEVEIEQEDVLGTEAGGVLTTEDGFPIAVES